MIKLDSTFHPSLNFFHAVNAGLSGTQSTLSFWHLPKPQRFDKGNNVSTELGRTELVKFLTLSNDLELCWSYAQVLFPNGFLGQGGPDKDATMARWS
jgi:hypothetical protein